MMSIKGGLSVLSCYEVWILCSFDKPYILNEFVKTLHNYVYR